MQQPLEEELKKLSSTEMEAQRMISAHSAFYRQDLNIGYKVLRTIKGSEQQSSTDYQPTSRAVGRAQYLKSASLNHKNLAKYLDFVAYGKDKVLVVGEHCNQNLVTVKDAHRSVSVWFQILDALCFLNNEAIVHRNLSPENVLLLRSDSGDYEVKLFDYGTYYMTDNGKLLEAFLGNISYVAPEVFLYGEDSDCVFHWKNDIWSVGMMGLELFSSKKIFPEGQDEAIEFYRNMLTGHERNEWQKIFNDRISSLLSMVDDEGLKECFKACLKLDFKERASYKDLFRLSVFNGLSRVTSPISGPFKQGSENPLESFPVNFVYYLWQVDGGDVSQEYARRKKNSAFKIDLVPVSISADGLVLSRFATKDNDDNSDSIETENVVELEIEKVKQSLFEGFESASRASSPSLRQDSNKIESSVFEDSWAVNQSENENFMNGDRTSYLYDLPFPLPSALMYLQRLEKEPLTVRQKDCLYQYLRLKIFSSLLLSYPASLNLIRKEASFDIPSLLRGKVWACLLGIEEADKKKYLRMDKSKENEIDRQIEVDLPRCHQYHYLLKSPTGFWKMKRLLKSWVITAKELVYWQGLDSICAAFLVNNYNDEASAYCSLAVFIRRYLPTFFQEDNAETIKAYLKVFGQLIIFHDPHLGKHLSQVGFLPDLYAIPWFLTFFTHVFSLHQIPQIWDKLLALQPTNHDYAFTLFIGLGILELLRSQLVQAEFNECVHIFSEVAGVDVSNCIDKAVHYLFNTPPSLMIPIQILSIASIQLATSPLGSSLESPTSPTRMSVLPRIGAIPYIESSDLFLLLKKGEVIVLDSRPKDNFIENHILNSWCLFPSLEEVKSESSNENQERKTDDISTSPPVDAELERMLIMDVKARYTALSKAVEKEHNYVVIVGFNNYGLAFEQKVTVRFNIIRNSIGCKRADRYACQRSIYTERRD